MIFTPYMAGASSKLPAFTYTGSYKIHDEGNGNWFIEFLTTGVFTSKSTVLVDVCVAGAGGGGRLGGGGGGYMNTVMSVTIKANTPYTITIGSGVAGERGGTTEAFNVSAEGGYPGDDTGNGGNGASGGGAWSNGGRSGNGGSDGADGEASHLNGGTGEIETTRPFGDETADPLSPGGGGGNYGGAGSAGVGGEVGGGDGGFGVAGEDGEENTGGGGGGVPNNGFAPTKGGSGIALIRNHREAV